MEKTFINLGGAELELRPISARQYLSARMESEKMAEQMGNDQVSKAVLLGASLLQRGMFDNDQRIFSSSDEVLDALSADEIISAASYIDISVDTISQIAEPFESSEKQTTPENKDSDRKSSNSGTDNEQPPAKLQPERKSESDTFYHSVSAGFSRSVSAHGEPPQNGMRRVSDFFQRDSRRYDGILSNY